MNTGTPWISSLFISLNTAVAEVSAAKQGVHSAEIALELNRVRHTEGASTNIAVVNAQDTLARAQENEIRTLYKHNLAKAKLAKAIGNLQGL